MKKLVLSAGVTSVSWSVSFAFALALAACGGDDSTNPMATQDAAAEAAVDSSVHDGAGDTGPVDAGRDAIAVDTGVVDASPPPRVLLSMNNATTCELLALDLATNEKNSLVYPGSFGTTFSRGDDPYVLEQNVDVVGKLDARQPWKVLSSWSVGLDDRADGGAAYADPLAIALAGTKGYVARYTRNKLAVVDTTQVADAGAPLSSIDLSAFLLPKDGDGAVEATFAFYVAKRHTVYVLLGNIDKGKYASDGTLGCADTTPLLVAIDTTTDKVVAIPGATGQGGSFVLTGFNPAFGAAGAAAVYDAAGDRLLVLHAGCNAPLGDGGEGPVTKRIVEELKFAANGSLQTTTLLDLAASGFPSAFAYIGPHDAVLGLGGEVRKWDPTLTTLGAALANAPDPNAFAYAGGGAIVGTRTNYPTDGGATSIDVVRTLLGDGGTTTLVTNPFKDNSGFIGGVEVWPTP
jgi:hypothetical protein